MLRKLSNRLSHAYSLGSDNHQHTHHSAQACDICKLKEQSLTIGTIPLRYQTGYKHSKRSLVLYDVDKKRGTDRAAQLTKGLAIEQCRLFVPDLLGTNPKEFLIECQTLLNRSKIGDHLFFVADRIDLSSLTIPDRYLSIWTVSVNSTFNNNLHPDKLTLLAEKRYRLPLQNSRFWGF